MSDGINKGRGLNSKGWCNRTNNKANNDRHMKFDAHSGKFEFVALNFRIVWRPNHWHLKDKLQKSRGADQNSRLGWEACVQIHGQFHWSSFYDCDNSNKRISLEKNLNHSASIREGPYVHRSSIVRDSVIACIMKGFSPFISFTVRNRMHPVSHSCPGCSIFFQWCVLKRPSMWKQCFQYI
jgi:hypothetical protein